jgi:hypothetical protein
LGIRADRSRPRDFGLPQLAHLVFLLASIHLRQLHQRSQRQGKRHLLWIDESMSQLMQWQAQD